MIAAGQFLAEVTNMNESSEGKTSGAGAENQANQKAADDVRKAFGDLPLDQKISTLIQVELDMVGDAVNGVVSAVSKVFDEVAQACDIKDESGASTSGPASQGSAS